MSPKKSNMEKFTSSRPRQLPLPVVDAEPKLLFLSPLTLTQIILYRRDLLIDSVIKYHDMHRFSIVTPGHNATQRIYEYIAGDNDA